MKKKKNKFLEDDGGAVTVDWVVLCALVVGLASVATVQITAGTEGSRDHIATAVTVTPPGQSE